MGKRMKGICRRDDGGKIKGIRQVCKEEEGGEKKGLGLLRFELSCECHMTFNPMCHHFLIRVNVNPTLIKDVMC